MLPYRRIGGRNVRPVDMVALVTRARLSSTRKAFVSKGDDVTFSRFVKLKPGEVDPDAKPKKRATTSKRQWKLPGMANPSIEAGRSIFHRNGVKPVSAMKSVLVSGHANVKIGRDVRKGKLFRGYWIFTVSLEERATCPRTCAHWQSCYGNNMPFAKRVDHRDRDALLAAITRDVERELGRRGRAGVLVRLHALGDFFDRDYVWFWRDLLWKHPNLAVFGYTAHDPHKSAIGFAIGVVKELFGERFAVRWSNNPDEDEWSTRTVVEPFSAPDAIQCPEQIGATDGCGKCGLCWNTKKNIAFTAH